MLRVWRTRETLKQEPRQALSEDVSHIMLATESHKQPKANAYPLQQLLKQIFVEAFISSFEGLHILNICKQIKEDLQGIVRPPEFMCRQELSAGWGGCSFILVLARCVPSNEKPPRLGCGIESNLSCTFLEVEAEPLTKIARAPSSS